MNERSSTGENMAIKKSKKKRRRKEKTQQGKTAPHTEQNEFAVEKDSVLFLYRPCSDLHLSVAGPMAIKGATWYQVRFNSQCALL
jgi:hypothetical protein